MRKTTRRFLAMRPSAEYQRVQRRPHPDSKLGECYQNAQRENRHNGSKIVSGWLITPTHDLRDGKANGVFHHFWNEDSTGVCYDTSPIGSDYEYVADPAVYWDTHSWSVKNSDITKGDIWMPPLLRFRNDSVMLRVGTQDKLDTAYWIPILEQPISIEAMCDLAYKVFNEEYV